MECQYADKSMMVVVVIIDVQVDVIFSAFLATVVDLKLKFVRVKNCEYGHLW